MLFGEMRTIRLRDSVGDMPDITREIDINLIGPIKMIQQFLPLLKKSPSAAILNVTSGLALQVPFPAVADLRRHKIGPPLVYKIAESSIKRYQYSSSRVGRTGHAKHRLAINSRISTVSTRKC